MTFTRPELGICAFNGSTANNIIWYGKPAHNFAPFIDPNPDAQPDRRFKAIAYHPSENGLGAFASADGYHWRLLADEPIITKGNFDSHNLAFYDPNINQYVSYNRINTGGLRRIQRCTSADFIKWTDPEEITYTDAHPWQMYTNNIAPYFRAPHIYLGMPARYVAEWTKDRAHGHHGISDGMLMSSRDGCTFDRWEEAFIRPGPEPEMWTDRNNYPAWGMLQTSPTEISLYWSEHYRHPTNRMRRGTIRTDGFVSVHAGGKDIGEILTRPITFTGDALQVNYATSAIGSVRFELCDPSGEALPGFSLMDSDVLFGNEIAHTVTWRARSSLAALAGTPLRLRIRLHDADVYSLRFIE